MVRKILLLTLMVGAYSATLGAQAQPQPNPPAEQKKEPLSAESGDVDILSDTMGVDFGPYLKGVMFIVKKQWYDMMPEVAKPPVLKSGTVIVEFAITKEGRVVGLHYVRSSGDIALDRAASGAITTRGSFLPLPQEFRGSFVMLRVRFLYNPAKPDAKPDSDHLPPAKQ